MEISGKRTLVTSDENTKKRKITQDEKMDDNENICSAVSSTTKISEVSSEKIHLVNYKIIKRLL